MCISLDISNCNCRDSLRTVWCKLCKKIFYFLSFIVLHVKLQIYWRKREANISWTRRQCRCWQKWAKWIKILLAHQAQISYQFSFSFDSLDDYFHFDFDSVFLFYVFFYLIYMLYISKYFIFILFFKTNSSFKKFTFSFDTAF